MTETITQDRLFDAPSKRRQTQRDSGRHVEYLSNGLGGPSMLLLYWMATSVIPATVAITADTGDELDCLISDGRRMSNREFFETEVVPRAKAWHIDVRMVRAVDKHGTELPPIGEYLSQKLDIDAIKHTKIPLFGSRGGGCGSPVHNDGK